MRVLLVRHGMTVGNLATARMAIRVAKGEVRPEDAHKIERDEAGERGEDEACGDTHLSDYKGGGVAEALALGEYWAPILKGKWDAGEMQIFVSPMLRCLQTADSLLKQLGSEATVSTKIMELPGLCAMKDRIWLDEVIRPLFDRREDAKARRLLDGRKWARCGYTSDEIRSMFPWAKSFEGFPEHDANGNARPWWPGCFERPGETERRIESVREWLLGLARELPKDDLVVLVSHGDTIWRVLASLMGLDATSEDSAVEHNTTNTSVSAIKIVPRGGKMEGRREKVSRNQNHLREFEVQLDFYNRTPHVVNLNGDHRNQDFYKFNKIMKREMRPGQRQVDLSKGMRAERFRNREFMAKL